MEKLVSKLPSQYDILKIDEDIANEVISTTTLISGYHINPFGSTADYIKNGIGFILKEENQIISDASSASIYKDSIEIQVDVTPLKQGMGLSKYIDAKLTLESLNQGLNPNWDAQYIVSRNLALSLGYRLKEEYKVHTVL